MTEEPKQAENEFMQAAGKEERGLVAEFVAFMAENKMWWLAPILIVFLPARHPADPRRHGRGAVPLLVRLRARGSRHDGGPKTVRDPKKPRGPKKLRRQGTADLTAP
jgi:hypothetical protein